MTKYDFTKPMPQVTRIAKNSEANKPTDINTNTNKVDTNHIICSKINAPIVTKDNLKGIQYLIVLNSLSGSPEIHEMSADYWAVTLEMCSSWGHGVQVEDA